MSPHEQTCALFTLCYFLPTTHTEDPVILHIYHVLGPHSISLIQHSNMYSCCVCLFLSVVYHAVVSFFFFIPPEILLIGHGQIRKGSVSCAQKPSLSGQVKIFACRVCDHHFYQSYHDNPSTNPPEVTRWFCLGGIFTRLLSLIISEIMPFFLVMHKRIFLLTAY